MTPQNNFRLFVQENKQWGFSGNPHKNRNFIHDMKIKPHKLKFYKFTHTKDEIDLEIISCQIPMQRYPGLIPDHADEGLIESLRSLLKSILCQHPNKIL